MSTIFPYVYFTKKYGKVPANEKPNTITSPIINNYEKLWKIMDFYLEKSVFEVKC